MLYLGQNITAVDDPLQPIEEEQLLARITNPPQETLSLLQQLQAVRTIDPKRYAEKKRKLPYFVCGTFNPLIRRSENFAYIDSFVLDIDHISAKGLSIDWLRMRILSDQRLMLCYSSPSGDGLKLLFRLSERCYDKGLYSVFYREFAQRFASQYHIEQVIDARTCDVTRACFLSHDPEAHYNPLSEVVDWKACVDSAGSTHLFEAKRSPEKAVSEAAPAAAPTPASASAASVAADHDPSADSIAKIKEVLGLYQAKQAAKPVYVPEQLNQIMDDLQGFLAEVDIVVAEIVDIQYGKKIRAKLGSKQAECNLFFGHRGFSAVISPRSGTDPQLNEMLQQLILAFLASR